MKLTWLAGSFVAVTLALVAVWSVDVNMERPESIARVEIETAIGRVWPVAANDDANNKGDDVTPVLNRDVHHVSPDGSPTGDGSAERPWDLASALAHPDTVKAGDIIWLHKGIYRGLFVSELKGENGNPVVVRSYPGEWATIEGCTTDSGGNAALKVNGYYTWFWGFEITNCSAGRSIDTTDSAPPGLYSGLEIFGHDTQFINLVIHDTAQGIGSWSDAKRVVLYGNVIFANGYDGSDRAHGHGIYAQNEHGTKRIDDNIIFNQFGHGFHGYAEEGHIDSLELQGNIVFGNGSASERFRMHSRNILVGGRPVAHKPMIIHNYTYFPISSVDGENALGYEGGCDQPTVYHNYFVGPVSLRITNCQGINMKHNTFIGPVNGVLSGDYSDNAYRREKPTGVEVFVRPNMKEQKRGHIVIYNWDQESTVPLNLATLGFQTGDRYRLRSVQNYFGDVTEGTLDGIEITLSMENRTVAAPIGGTAPPSTFPDFGSFVIEQVH